MGINKNGPSVNDILQILNTYPTVNHPDGISSGLHHELTGVIRTFMNLRMKLAAALTVTLLGASALSASAFPLLGKKKPAEPTDTRKLTPEQSALIDAAIKREVVVHDTLKKTTPLVETYIQNMKPDPIMGAAPESDNHFLGRVSFDKVIINDKGYAREKREDPKSKGKFSAFSHSLTYLSHLSASLHLTYNEAGFVAMLLVDSSSFNRQTYNFYYWKSGFIGTIPVWIFDVQPAKKGAVGRFAGRIYVTHYGNTDGTPGFDPNTSGYIVRYNGSFSGGQSDISEYFHFDSWRSNVQPGLWLPTASFIQETDPKSPMHTVKFKAVNHIWGYSLKTPQQVATATSAELVTSDVQKAPSDQVDYNGQDQINKLVEEGENNVLDRLFQAGLIDGPSDFDDPGLSYYAQNLVYVNGIQTDRPLKVRVLLTEPLETLAIGDTILISKGLLDTIYTPNFEQYEANLYSIIAFQVAHIELGHHIDEKYVFSDFLLFPNESSFQRLPMQHIDADNATAAKRAIELLDKLAATPTPAGGTSTANVENYFGLYLQQLKAIQPGLKALNTPQIGDSLIKPDGTFWLQALISKSPKLNNPNLTQRAAMPLDEQTKTDPWTDKVSRKNIKSAPALLSPRGKIPFEVVPVYIGLAPYQAPPDPNAATPISAPATTVPADGTVNAAPDGAAASGTTTPPADGTTTPAPATTTPAPTTGTSNPPADTTTPTTTTQPAPQN